MSTLGSQAGFGDVRESLVRYGQLSGGLVAIILVWEAFVRITKINAVLLPSPSAIVQTSVEEFGFFWHHSLVTVTEIFVGFWAGVLFGFFAAVGIYYVPFLRRGLYPLLATINQVPKISFAPLLLVWFGSGLVTNAIISLFIVFFPMLVNTVAGLNESDEDLVELAKLYHVDERFMFMQVRLPSAMPLMFAAMKLGTALAVIGAVTAEFISSGEGLGFVIITASGEVKTTEMFAAIVFVTVIAILLYVVVLAIERRLLFWYEGDEE